MTKRCPVCGQRIRRSYRICAKCADYFGHATADWPQWLRYLVNDIQREQRQDLRAATRSISYEGIFEDEIHNGRLIRQIHDPTFIPGIERRHTIEREFKGSVYALVNLDNGKIYLTFGSRLRASRRRLLSKYRNGERGPEDLRREATNALALVEITPCPQEVARLYVEAVFKALRDEGLPLYGMRDRFRVK